MPAWSCVAISPFVDNLGYHTRVSYQPTVVHKHTYVEKLKTQSWEKWRKQGLLWLDVGWSLCRQFRVSNSLPVSTQFQVLCKSFTWLTFIPTPHLSNLLISFEHICNSSFVIRVAGWLLRHDFKPQMNILLKECNFLVSASWNNISSRLNSQRTSFRFDR